MKEELIVTNCSSLIYTARLFFLLFKLRGGAFGSLVQTTLEAGIED